MNSSKAPAPTNAKGVATDGAKLRTLREIMGLTRTALADQCEVTPGYISHIENNVRRPSAPVFARLCDALGVSNRQVLLAQEQSSRPKRSGKAAA